MIDRAELEAWLRLTETPGIGRESVRKLLAAFGSPQAVLQAPVSCRAQVVSSSQAAALSKLPAGLDALVDATLAWLDTPLEGQSAHAFITLGDARYPASLLDSPDPPIAFYAAGQLALLHPPAIAIVGSRNPTPQGSDNARAFARELSASGLIVVSGLALGIDAAAHAGAFEGPSGTIAVVGTGLDQTYPPRNHALAQHIARAGLLISEYALGTPPKALHFPQRNRIIAGLARGTLVVEAALKSGSLITARLANEGGREVFAIPGSIHSPQSRGCHALIKQGAKLVETAQDVLEEIGTLSPPRRMPVASTASNPALVETSTALSTAIVRSAIPSTSPAIDANPADQSDPLLTALGFDPITLDALAVRTGDSAESLSVRLFDLELAGEVAKLPGQLFQRIQPG